MLDDYPRLTTMAFGAQFLQGATLVMISSLSQASHNPYRFNILFSWALMAVNAISFLRAGSPLIDDFKLISFVCALSWAGLAWYVYFVLDDFKRILNADAFPSKERKA